MGGKNNMLKERKIPITVNLTLSEMAELVEEMGNDSIESAFHKELTYCENLIVKEIVDKIDEKTLQILREYFKVSNIIVHFDTSEFFNTLEDAVRNKTR